MPLYRRLPKRGFLPYGGKTDFAVVNVKDLSARFAAGSVVDPDGLVEAGLIKKSGRQSVKVLGDGDIAHALTVKAHRVSEGAKQKLEAAGGRIEVLPAPRREVAAGKGGAGSAKREARSTKRSAATTKREAPTT